MKIKIKNDNNKRKSFARGVRRVSTRRHHHHQQQQTPKAKQFEVSLIRLNHRHPTILKKNEKKTKIK